jgi:uncharacterized protein (DUF58 family)
MTLLAGSGVVVSLHELLGLRARVQPGLVRRVAAGIASAGSHAAPRQSRGMEFAEARPYQPGDDVRALDWRQTARRGRPYTKLFQEEHERPVHLLVDLGASMRFGTRCAFKSVIAARAAALLAWSAVAAGDRIGGLVWNGAEFDMIRPQSRHRGVLALLGCLAKTSAAPAPQARTLAMPLRTLARTLRPGSLVVVISDFATLDAEAERQIVTLAGSAELVLLQTYDIFESETPPPGRYRFTDGQRSLNLDLHSLPIRKAYAAAFAGRRASLEQLARRAGATLLPLATHDSPEMVLASTLLHRSCRQPSPAHFAA